MFFITLEEAMGEWKCYGLNIASSLLKLMLEYSLHGEVLRGWGFNWKSVEMCGCCQVIRMRHGHQGGTP